MATQNFLMCWIGFKNVFLSQGFFLPANYGGESLFALEERAGLPRVREKSGKNKIFSRSGNCQGILKKCQGILAIWPMSGKCQGILSWQLIFFWTWLAFFCLHTFSSPKIFVSLASLSIYSHHTFFKMFYYFYEYCFILLLSGKNI